VLACTKTASLDSDLKSASGRPEARVGI
jgi:hypothetical protein